MRLMIRPLEVEIQMYFFFLQKMNDVRSLSFEILSNKFTRRMQVPTNDPPEESGVDGEMKAADLLQIPRNRGA